MTTLKVMLGLILVAAGIMGTAMGAAPMVGVIAIGALMIVRALTPD